MCTEWPVLLKRGCLAKYSFFFLFLFFGLIFSFPRAKIHQTATSQGLLWLISKGQVRNLLTWTQQELRRGCCCCCCCFLRWAPPPFLTGVPFTNRKAHQLRDRQVTGIMHWNMHVYSVAQQSSKDSEIVEVPQYRSIYFGCSCQCKILDFAHPKPENHKIRAGGHGMQKIDTGCPFLSTHSPPLLPHPPLPPPIGKGKGW